MQIASGVGESQTLAFAEAAKQRRSVGLPIISLGLGEPDFRTPEAFTQAVNTVLASKNSSYSAAAGVPQLKEAIAQKIRSENHIGAESADIVVTAGAKQALSLTLMAMLEPGDEVIILAPFFVSFLPQALLAEPQCIVRIVNVSSDTNELSISELESVVNDKTRAIIINSPNNPTGYQFDEASLQSILTLAEKFDAYVISDEVYEKLNWGGVDHLSIGSYEDHPTRVVTINGFSKSHAMTGWRLGYAVLPEKIRKKVVLMQQHINTNTCTFVQQATATAWDPSCPHLPPYLEILKSRAGMVSTWLESTSGARGIVHPAGFFAFISIAELTVDSNTFCAGLLQECGVAVTPGIAFGSAWDDHFRLSYAVTDENLHTGLQLISDYLQGFQA